MVGLPVSKRFWPRRSPASWPLAADPAGQEARRQALADHSRLQRDIAALRAQAGKEKQVNRRVELNLEIKRLEAELGRTREGL